MNALILYFEILTLIVLLFVNQLACKTELNKPRRVNRCVRILLSPRALFNNLIFIF